MGSWSADDIQKKGLVVIGGAGKKLDLPKSESKIGKYKNIRITYDGILWDSKKECERYKVLVLLQEYNQIQDLKWGVPFDLLVNGIKVAWYKADFTYMKNGVLIIEDTKSPVTRKNRIYRLKKKMIKAQYGIDILET